MPKEVYEILGRPVTKEQYEAASKKMDAPQSEVEKEMDDFAKRAKRTSSSKKVRKSCNWEEEGWFSKIFSF
jgi:hypothetical protein